jgi:hypothetical protein
MILVEEMDRTLKAWVRDYGDFNPEALQVLETLGKLDIMFRTREPRPHSRLALCRWQSVRKSPLGCKPTLASQRGTKTAIHQKFSSREKDPDQAGVLIVRRVTGGH